MENIKAVEIVSNKTYFKENAMVISFKFINRYFNQKHSDWIALYKCSSNRHLEEFVAVETDLKMHTPTKYGFHQVIFCAYQLKNVKCNEAYEFLYGNEFNEIYGISHPVRFIHQNECYCYPNNLELETNQSSSCVSEDLINSLLTRTSILDSQLTECKIRTNEIVSINKRMMTRMNENEVIFQKNNEFLNNLFYSNEPVTRDGYWMETCADVDLTKSCIESNEYELQDLHTGFKKADKIKISKGTQSDESHLLIDLDTDKVVDCTVEIVNAESVFTPEPSTSCIVFIDSFKKDNIDYQ